MMVPWRPVVTVAAIAFVSVSAMAFGQELIAAAAAGALVTYLGRMNGRAEI